MGVPTARQAEMEAGLAQLAARFAANQFEIIETTRPWRDRTATYLVIGKDDLRTDIAISDEFLRDLPNTREHQQEASAYAEAIGGRIKCGSPEIFHCQSGSSVRIEIRWPITSSVVNSELLSLCLVQISDLSNGMVAKCAVDMTRFSFPEPSPFDDVRSTINRVRRAIDAGLLTFQDRKTPPSTYQRVRSDLGVADARPSDDQIQRFLADKTYSLGFRTIDKPGEVWTADPWDADYLGVTLRDLRQAAHVLQARKLIAINEGRDYARPSDKLLAEGRAALDSVVAVSAKQKVSLSNLPGKDRFLADVTSSLANHSELALVIIDLDNFKSVNDTQGHAGGDACLERVVQVIGSALGSKGTLYRWGGDEFAVRLIDFSTEEAHATAERIRRAVEDAHPGNEISVTTSIGVSASGRVQSLSTAELFEAADQALYASKRRGKNRVTSWPVNDV